SRASFYPTGPSHCGANRSRVTPPSHASAILYSRRLIVVGCGTTRTGDIRGGLSCISQPGTVIAEVSSPPLSLCVSAARRYPGNSYKLVRKILQQIVKRDYAGQRAVRPDDRKTPYTAIAHPLNGIVN